jgi:hypothetical protein
MSKAATTPFLHPIANVRDDAQPTKDQAWSPSIKIGLATFFALASWLVVAGVIFLLSGILKI